MKSRNLLLVLAAAAILAGQTADMGVTLERAIRKENVEGDLSGAIELYKQVVAKAANRADVAKALLGLGECYEKQGSAEAQKAYERLVKEFGDQAEAARTAQSRLAAMGQARGEGVVAQLIVRDVGGDESDDVHGSINAADRWGRVTPDGKLHVFIDRGSGNLAVRDLQSGTVRRLTNDATGTRPGDVRASSPAPSRDGKHIAYIWKLATSHPGSDVLEEIRVINVDGSGMYTVPAKLNRTQYYVRDWTSDGARLLVWGVVPMSTPAPPEAVPGDKYGFSFVDLKTGTEHAFVRGLGGRDAGLSPDGRWMVHSGQGAAPNPNGGIFAVDTQTGQERAVVAGSSIYRDSLWVPGSDRIVFRSDQKGTNGIWMVRFRDGSAAGDPVLLKADAGAYTALGISRDGSFFYGLSHESSDIYSVEVDPRTLRPASAPTLAVTSYPGRNMFPAWSPSGDAFAYYSAREGDEIPRIVIQRPAGRETVASRTFFLSNPVHWCSNNLIATEGPQRRLDANTGEVLPVLPAQQVQGLHGPRQFVYSPDCRFAYVSSALNVNSENQRRRIYRNEISTGKETDLLVDRGEWGTMPLVSPDERWLVFHGNLEGATKHSLLLLPIEGGALRALDIDDMQGLGWTPDSKRLLVSRRVKRVNGQGPDSELYWVSVEGGASQSMGIRMNGLMSPSLNPDGKRLLFSSTETSNELWVLRNLGLK